MRMGKELAGVDAKRDRLRELHLFRLNLNVIGWLHVLGLIDRGALHSSVPPELRGNSGNADREAPLFKSPTSDQDELVLVAVKGVGKVGAEALRDAQTGVADKQFELAGIDDRHFGAGAVALGDSFGA